MPLSYHIPDHPVNTSMKKTAICPKFNNLIMSLSSIMRIKEGPLKIIHLRFSRGTLKQIIWIRHSFTSDIHMDKRQSLSHAIHSVKEFVIELLSY